MSKEYAAFGENLGRVPLPQPTPETQELTRVISQVAAGQGSRQLEHNFTSPLTNAHGLPMLRSATVVEKITGDEVTPYRSVTEASVNDAHPEATHGALNIGVISGDKMRITKTDISFNPRLGRFEEYTTAKIGLFEPSRVIKNSLGEGMTPRRTLAAAKLARIKFGLKQSKVE